jgi:peptide chain release factor 1
LSTLIPFHLQTTDSAVRITHLPTKITASIQDERSQHKNKEKALRLVAARVRDFRKSTEEKARGETRSSLMGGGDRSERIRTYNFPQDRVTDHRSKESHFGINALLNTEANIVLTFLPLLHKLHREEKIEGLGEHLTNAQ